MKARIINTPVEVEVMPYFQEGMFAGFTDVRGKLRPGMIVYKTSDLEFIDKPEPLKPIVDWDAFRREAAKEILVGLCANNNLGFYGNSNTELATSAITLADELIKQLMEEK